MRIQERFSLRKSAVGLVSVSLLCTAIYAPTVVADTVTTRENLTIEELQEKKRRLLNQKN